MLQYHSLCAPRELQSVTILLLMCSERVTECYNTIAYVLRERVTVCCNTIAYVLRESYRLLQYYCLSAVIEFQCVAIPWHKCNVHVHSVLCALWSATKGICITKQCTACALHVTERFFVPADNLLKSSNMKC